MAKVLTTEKRIFRDPDFIFLAINAALVIIGYGLAVYTGLNSVGIMKVVKSFVLILSFIVLLKDLNLSKNSIKTPSVIYIFIFSFWIILMSFFSERVVYALGRSLDFLVPLTYVYISLHNLLGKYEVVDLLKAFIKAMNIVYVIPVISYLLSGAGFGQINIYGEGMLQGQLFVSNHYGWASAIFILTSVDIWLNLKPRRMHKIYLLVFTFLALYVALISGNRSSWLSLTLGIIILIVRLKNIRTDFKIFLILIPIAAAVWMASIPNSSINSRFNDTQNQLEKGEARFNTARLAIDEFNDNKILWVTGAGMFNYDKIIHGEGLGDYHDSYLEVLFGGGIILFLLFINFMVFRPVYFYIMYYSKYFIIFPPFIVIPLFESNLTGGQFIFFPWFIFMLLFNMSPYVKKTSQKETQKITYKRIT